MSYHYKRKSVEEKRAEIEKLSDELKEGVKNYLESDHYKEILDNFSKFYDYSYRNSMLILLQKPDASAVASYTRWKNDFNRQVNYGEKGIKIIQPLIKKENEKSNLSKENPNDEMSEKDEEKVIGYKVTYTFDISQTSQIEGKPVIDLEIAHDLKGKVHDYEDLKTAIISAAPVPISFEKMEGGTKGFYSPLENRIAIQEDMSEAQTIKTMIHETAHSVLHSKEALEKMSAEGQTTISRDSMEVQAESIAYVVSSHYGLDTSDYSFPYVAAWANDPTVLEKNLTTIKNGSAKIIENMDSKLVEIQQEKLNVSVQDVQEDTKEFSFDSQARALAKEADEFFKGYNPSNYYSKEIYSGANFDKYFSDIRNGKVDTLESLKQIDPNKDYFGKEADQLRSKLEDFNEHFSDNFQKNLDLEETRSLKM